MFFATKAILLKSQITELDYYKPSKRKLLDVNVSDTGLNDAETFLLKLFAAAEKAGLRVRLAAMNKSLRRRNISVSEDDSRDFLYPSFWRPSNESVICVECLNVGFSLVEVTVGYYSWRHIPCGQFRFQLYSPYEPDGWHQVFTQTKNCGLISQKAQMIKAAQAAVPIMKKEIQSRKERAEAERLRIEQQIIEYEKREAIRLKEEAYKQSVDELYGIMAKWVEDRRVEQFFTDAERDIQSCDPVLKEKLRERLRAAKELMQGETALQLLLKWRTPDERLK